MPTKKRNKNKFEFGTDFQELILQYTVTDPNGYKALSFYEDSYFSLIPHQVIAYALKQYYKKNKRIPEEPYLREHLRVLYQRDNNLTNNLLQEDRESISNLVKKLYSRPVAEPMEVITKCVYFARYVKFKGVLGEVDINQYDSYEAAIKRLNSANNIGIELENDYGTFLVKGMTDRAHKRDQLGQINPTPWRQLNQLLNSGGLTSGSVIVLLGKEKRFKTGALINLARGYLRMKKVGIYIDLENGEASIMTRTEQSISNREQKEITSGDMDTALLKTFRKYKRIGSELIIKRFSALQDTTDSFQKWVDKLWIDHGIKPHYAIVDYGVLMGSKSGKDDDFGRISDSFLDLKNFANDNHLEAVWTAAHTTREAKKREAYVYQSTDIAKCIDIPRHVDAIFGLQESEEETENGVMRLEVVEQRNGMRNGNCLFWVDVPRQRMKEFTHAEVKEYRAQTGESGEGKTYTKKEKKVDL